MAEAFLNQIGAGRFAAQSAGIEPGNLNPVVVEVMREIAMDISRNRTKSVTEMLESGPRFDFVITVCDEASAERCPTFPGGAVRLHWGFPDPSSFKGDPANVLGRTRGVRDEIRKRIEEWCRTTDAPPCSA